MELELVFNWVIKASIMASILAALILLVKYALQNKLDAKWQYAMWMILIIRLLIPYDIQSPWSIYSLLPNNSAISPIVNLIRIPNINAQIGNILGKEIQLTKYQSITNKQSNTKEEGPAKNYSYSWIFAILWLAGVLILAILAIATNLRFYFKVRGEPFTTDLGMSKLMQECTRKLGIRKKLPIIIMNGIYTPCLYGILSPKLLLPKSLVNRLNEENIRHIVMHELSHYKRKDILINWLAVAAQIVHWFNPLIWYSFARMREDCELACDADTLSSLKPEEYQSYGLSIISLLTPAQLQWIPGTTGFFGNKNSQQIRRRIKMIKIFHKPTSKWTLAAVVIFISLGLVGFTNSISNATPETGTFVNSNSIALAKIPNTEAENNKLTRNIDSISAIATNPVFPVNQNGETYGSNSEVTVAAQGPDLILAAGIDGTVGYMKLKDLNKDQPNNPEEAVAYMEKMKNGPTYSDIPLYAADGDTVVGKFRIFNPVSKGGQEISAKQETDTAAATAKGE
ncbi:M56 family metallopeptidase [Desulfosporosinus fructosivorans]